MVGGVRDIPGNCVPVPAGLPPRRHEVVRFHPGHLAGELGERLLHVARREGAAPPRVEQRLQDDTPVSNFPPNLRRFREKGTHLRLDGECLQRRDADLRDLEKFELITERFGDGVDRLLVRGA